MYRSLRLIDLERLKYLEGTLSQSVIPIGATCRGLVQHLLVNFNTLTDVLPAGVIESILEEPDAFVPLTAALQHSRDDSQNQVDDSLGTIYSGAGSTPAAPSSTPSPAGSRRSAGEGMSAETTISLDVPMETGVHPPPVCASLQKHRLQYKPLKQQA